MKQNGNVEMVNVFDLHFDVTAFAIAKILQMNSFATEMKNVPSHMDVVKDNFNVILVNVFQMKQNVIENMIAKMDQMNLNAITSYLTDNHNNNSNQNIIVKNNIKATIDTISNNKNINQIIFLKMFWIHDNNKN
jgi:hypothetical protein